MAGTQKNAYSVSDANLTSLMSTTDAQRKGYCAASLTHWSDTTVPAIAAGSEVEVNGALFEFATEEAIGGSPSDGVVYIKLIPSGTSITAEFTNTAPAWDTEKQGWYSTTGGEENYRYLPFTMIKATSAYSNKRELADVNTNQIAVEKLSGGIGSALSSMFQITLLTGTLDGSGDAYVAFPTGFTSDNCYIISCKLGLGASQWRDLHSATNVADQVATSATFVPGNYIMINGTTYHANEPYQMLLMRII
jgi:hypothetical protein